MIAMIGDATMAAQDDFRASLVRLQAERGAELWALARDLGLASDEADDAVQETLLRLWAALRDGAAIERPDACGIGHLMHR